ncbi:MAG: tetratricopeptide repeat protein, partial [Bacteroidota bacterium]
MKLLNTCFLVWIPLILGSQMGQLFGQNSFDKAKLLIKQAQYRPALEELNRWKGDISTVSTLDQLEWSNALAEVHLKLAAFDSVRIYLDYPAQWKSLSTDAYPSAILEKYLLELDWALAKKEERRIAEILQKLDQLIPKISPERFAELELKKVRLHIINAELQTARERLENLQKQEADLSDFQKGAYFFEWGLYALFDRELEARMQKSLDAFLKAETYYKKSLPPTHPSIALTYSYQSYPYRGLDMVKEALESNKKAIEIQEQILGSGHPNLAISYYYYANILNLIKDHASAAKYAEQAIQIYKKSAGPEYERIEAHTLGNFYGSLGTAYRGMREARKARTAFGQALEYYQVPPPYRQIDQHYYN